MAFGFKREKSADLSDFEGEQMAEEKQQQGAAIKSHIVRSINQPLYISCYIIWRRASMKQ